MILCAVLISLDVGINNDFCSVLLDWSYVPNALLLAVNSCRRLIALTLVHNRRWVD